MSSPAGWYPDPSGQGQRYFDGTDWTPHRTPYLSEAQRTAILQAELVRYTGLGGRVLAWSSTSASLESGQPVNHDPPTDHRAAMRAVVADLDHHRCDG